jgi:hypothetical protein
MEGKGPQEIWVSELGRGHLQESELGRRWWRRHQVGTGSTRCNLCTSNSRSLIPSRTLRLLVSSRSRAVRRSRPKGLTLPVPIGFALIDGNSSAYAYAQPEPQPQPMPTPVPAARALSPQSQFTNTTVSRVDPYTNPGYMHDQVPYPSHNPYPETQSDAYAGYETPNTARPMDDPAGYGQSYPQDPAGYGQSYPQPQMNEGIPHFPTSGELPTYVLAADATSQGQGQPARLAGSNDKSGGHFR